MRLILLALIAIAAISVAACGGDSAEEAPSEATPDSESPVGEEGTVEFTLNSDAFAEGQRVLVAPNGTRIEIEDRDPPLVMPETVHSVSVSSEMKRPPVSSARRRMKCSASSLFSRIEKHIKK